jgi:predicted nuclease of predicted toxin-antitoxin system
MRARLGVMILHASAELNARWTCFLHMACRQQVSVRHLGAAERSETIIASWHGHRRARDGVGA